MRTTFYSHKLFSLQKKGQKMPIALKYSYNLRRQKSVVKTPKGTPYGVHGHFDKKGFAHFGAQLSTIGTQ